MAKYTDHGKYEAKRKQRKLKAPKGSKNIITIRARRQGKDACKRFDTSDYTR